MKSVDDKWLIVICAVLFILLLFSAGRSHAGQYEYRGVFRTLDVVTSYCDRCYLELPPEYLDTRLVMAVDTDDSTEVFKALQTSSRAVGWQLTRTTGGLLRAQPLENVGMVVYVSCLDHQPKNVPRYMYAAALKSDSILCWQRDSLLAVDRHQRDSVAAVKPLDFRNYEIRYYSYTKAFTDKLGVNWQQLLSSGNLRGDISFYDNWAVQATQTNDTAFTQRSLMFSVDSTINLDWGSEEQALKQTFVNDGVTTQDYEWRKYGMIVSVRRDGKRVKMDYTFRDKENAESVLQGSVIGQDGDTLHIIGNYMSHRQVETGVPVLAHIPIIGYIFRTTNDITDNRAFELYLLPKQQGDGNEAAAATAGPQGQR